MGWGDLRQFLNYYTTDDEDTLRNLKRYIRWEQKNDHLQCQNESRGCKGSSRETEQVIDCQMPSDRLESIRKLSIWSTSGLWQRQTDCIPDDPRSIASSLLSDSDEAADGNTYVSARLGSAPPLKFSTKFMQLKRKRWYSSNQEQCMNGCLSI